jgi:hypothetical protein
LGDQLNTEDSIFIYTERSFNLEPFTSDADYPMQLSPIPKSFKENDTGLEYIGEWNQQMGDGGFIAQFIDNSSAEPIGVSDSSGKCMVAHEAPMDKSCENLSNPITGEAPYDFNQLKEPVGWTEFNFDDSNWTRAIEYSATAVDPTGGYDRIDWHSNAKLLWSSDLETHNTLFMSYDN